MSFTVAVMFLVLAMNAPAHAARNTTMTGSMTNATGADIARGGLTLTLTLVGDFDSWTSTAAVIAGIVSDQSSGFNALRSTILSPATINGRAMIFGPTPPVASYIPSAANEKIVITIPNNAVTSGLPAGSPLFFTIAGTCHLTKTWNMNTPENAFRVAATYFELVASPSVSGSNTNEEPPTAEPRQSHGRATHVCSRLDRNWPLPLRHEPCR